MHPGTNPKWIVVFVSYGQQRHVAMRTIRYDKATNMLGVKAELQAFPKYRWHECVGIRSWYFENVSLYQVVHRD